MGSPQHAERHQAAFTKAAESTATPEEDPGMPEIRGAAQVRNVAAQGPTQAIAPCNHLPSGPAAAEVAMLGCAIEDEKEDTQGVLQHKAPLVYAPPLSPSWPHVCPAERAPAGVSGREDEEEAVVSGQEVEVAKAEDVPAQEQQSGPGALWDPVSLVGVISSPTQVQEQEKGVPDYDSEEEWSRPPGEGWNAGDLPIEDSDEEDEWCARMRRAALMGLSSPSSVLDQETGGLPEQPPPVKFCQEVYSLAKAAGSDPRMMRRSLQRTHSSSAVLAVQEASRAGMAALQEGTCAAQTLQEHVAAVYNTVEQALSRGAERGKTPDALDCADTLMYIRAYRPEVEPEMREKYKGCGRPAWTVTIAMYMAIIQEAAIGALESGAL